MERRIGETADDALDRAPDLVGGERAVIVDGCPEGPGDRPLETAAVIVVRLQLPGTRH